MFLNKILVLVCWLTVVGITTAQRWSTQQQPFVASSSVTSFAKADKADGIIQINYFEEDANVFGTNYQRILVPINQNYTTLLGDSLIRKAVIGFDAIPQNFYQHVRAIAQVRIDSIFIELGHQNVSGKNDTIIFHLLKADTNGYPLPSIYWSDTIITVFGLSTGNNWNNTLVHALKCDQVLDDYENFAIEIQYFGNVNDSFGIVAAYPFDGNCASVQQKRAVKSSFYPNSFAYWNQWNLLLPTAVGGDVFYDCDGDDLYIDSIDGENFIQNWHIGVQISSPNISVNSYELSTLQVFPNPVSDWLTIANAPLGASLEIFTIDGKLIQKNSVHGEHLSIPFTHVTNGVYIIKIQYLDTIRYAKIVVAH